MKMTPANPEAVQLGLEVIVSEEDKLVYVKISGFETLNDAENYADYLTERLPLMLFESEVKH